MTAVAEIHDVDRSAANFIVGNGAKLGVITTLGVVVFALLSRSLEGTAEMVVQSTLILVGGIVVSFLPALWIRSRSMDGMAWAMLVALLGGLFFTVIDTAALRPLELYHWTWDAIGGGSGFWYIPVWWLLSAYLAGLGALLVKNNSDGEQNATLAKLLPRTGVLTVVVFAAITMTDTLPAVSAVVGLSFAIALTVDSIISAIQNPE
jgi:hypothetical protein